MIKPKDFTCFCEECKYFCEQHFIEYISWCSLSNIEVERRGYCTRGEIKTLPRFDNNGPWVDALSEAVDRERDKV